MSDFLSAERVNRFESIGDNCEFGFVTRKLSIEIGSLFRWTRMKTASLNSILKGDLVQPFEYNHLRPLSKDMVRETTYKIGWHTKMYSVISENKRVFRDPEELRYKTYKIEKQKINYLRDKFLLRLKAGGVIYVVKNNLGIAPDLLDSIHAEMRRLSGGAHFWVLEIRETADTTLHGTVAAAAADRMVGYVSSFAPYARALPDDYASWHAIMRSALEMAPYDQWQDAVEEVERGLGQVSVKLPFPERTGPGEEKRISTPFRFGVAELTTHHDHSRKRNFAFRIHGATRDKQTSQVVWILRPHLEMAKFICSVKLSVPNSDPVHVEVVVQSGDEVLARNILTIANQTPVEVMTEPFRATGEIRIALNVRGGAPPIVGRVVAVDISAPVVNCVLCRPILPKAITDPSQGSQHSNVRKASQLDRPTTATRF